jgi:hypothetical protein
MSNSIKDYQPTQEQFQKDVADWKMETLHENGLYRHLRFRLQGGGFAYFDIVTWPGRLVITGDCETFTFTRLQDMFEFFRTDGQRINPGYWQEKIIDGSGRARRFDWDTLRADALACFDVATESMDPEQRQEAREELESDLDSEPDEYGAVNVLRNFAYRDGRDVLFQFNLCEGAPDGKDWDYHYIWCCRAIAWAIEQYDAAKAVATEAST